MKERERKTNKSSEHAFFFFPLEPRARNINVLLFFSFFFFCFGGCATTAFFDSISVPVRIHADDAGHLLGESACITGRPSSYNRTYYRAIDRPHNATKKTAIQMTIFFFFFFPSPITRVSYRRRIPMPAGQCSSVSGQITTELYRRRRHIRTSPTNSLSQVNIEK